MERKKVKADESGTTEQDFDWGGRDASFQTMLRINEQRPKNNRIIVFEFFKFESWINRHWSKFSEVTTKNAHKSSCHATYLQVIYVNLHRIYQKKGE